MDQNTVKQLIADAVALSEAKLVAAFDIKVDSVRQDLGARVEAVDARVDVINKLEEDLDAQFPFRAYRASCDAEAWAFGWKKLMIDQDHLANAAEQMGDPAFAQVMSALASHPNDVQLKQLKEAASLKNAPKVSFKELCLRSHGGGPERFRGFMVDKSEDSSDPTVACIARWCLSLYLLLEKRYTSLRSNKRSSSDKIEGQKAELMTLVYHGCKFLKLQSRKAAARTVLESELLARDFGPAITFGLAKTALASHPVSVAASSYRPDTSKRSSAFSEPAPVRIKSEPVPREQSVSREQSVARSGPNGKKIAVSDLKAELEAFARGRPAADIQNWIDNQFNSQSSRPIAATLMSQLCRNCLLAGRGIVGHSRAQCEELGNSPVNPCPDCAKGGKTEYHWRAKCPKRG
jgi:hypothetical protein